MVGDSKNDVISAKNANCTCVLVSYGYGNINELNSDPKTKAEIIINDILDVYNIVQNAQ